MNFLGHLYFSDNNLELMYANLFGDYVKGSDLNGYSHVVRSGIILHRNIDNYIDHHPEVLKMMHCLYPELPKVTGIAIDLFFDHLLAKNWDNYHPIPFEEFLENFYIYNPLNWDEYSIGFKVHISKLRENNWINYYPEIYGLKKACEGVSSRLSFDNELKNATTVFLNHEKEIEHCFELFMADALPFFREKINLLNL